MTDLGSLNYFLGVSAQRSTTGLFLSQATYAEELLERAHMKNCNPCRTPVDTNSKLVPDGDPASDPTFIWEAFGGNTRDLNSIWEETGQECNSTQNQRDLPRNTPLDRVEVLVMQCTTLPSHSESLKRFLFHFSWRSIRFYRLSLSEIADIEKVAICSSLRLSNNKYALIETFRVILFSIHSDEWKSFHSQHKRALRNFRYYDTARLPSSDKVLKLKNFKKDDYSSFQDQEKYEHVGLKITSTQDGKRSQDDDKRLCLADDLKEAQVHVQVKLKGTSSSLKSKITMHITS
ncbi:ribonuclease H-like domain-containing protein [Tanacetum coccineum]